jgi:hypothetical protein
MHCACDEFDKLLQTLAGWPRARDAGKRETKKAAAPRSFEARHGR